MKVYELIGLLQECDQEAEVRIMCQPNYPFENAVSGVAVREEFTQAECECDARFTEPHEEGCPAGGELEYEDGLEARDVFICEGPQERYGSKEAFLLART